MNQHIDQTILNMSRNISEIKTHITKHKL